MKHNTYSPLGDNPSANRLFLASKLSVPWPSLPTILPHRIRRRFKATRSKLRSRQSPTSTIASLTKSFLPSNTLNALAAHQWSFYDGQYILLAVFGIFSLCIIQSPGPVVKTLIATLLLTALIPPVTQQFFLPLLPIFTWLVFFYSCQFIGGEYRPPIWVRVLPALENIFYGANISNIMSAHKNTFQDVLAWLPYGITHFGAPFVCSIVLFIFGPPGTLPSFARTFGYMNLIGVVIQLLFPCAPPWYENLYGLAPANYSMPGSPAGLAAIDKLFGIGFYTTTFTASPMVFGAFPSLHAGCATTEALFMSHVFPRLKPLFIAYTLWLWWATMYLTHHYAVDLVGGSLLAVICFFVTKVNFLPRVQRSKTSRWDYDFVERGEPKEPYSHLKDFDEEAQQITSASDEYALSDSTCVARNTSPGAKSPVDDNSSLWDEETLGFNSDSEQFR